MRLSASSEDESDVMSMKVSNDSVNHICICLLCKAHWTHAHQGSFSCDPLSVHCLCFLDCNNEDDSKSESYQLAWSAPDLFGASLCAVEELLWRAQKSACNDFLGEVMTARTMGDKSNGRAH